MKSPTITVTVLRVAKAFLESGRAGRLSGYRIAVEMSVPQTTVWHILNKLEEAGWLASELESVTLSGRPARRLFRMTDLGLVAMTQALAPFQTRIVRTRAPNQPVRSPAPAMMSLLSAST